MKVYELAELTTNQFIYTPSDAAVLIFHRTCYKETNIKNKLERYLVGIEMTDDKICMVLHEVIIYLKTQLGDIEKNRVDNFPTKADRIIKSHVKYIGKN